MAPFVNLDDEHRTYPPASQYRMRHDIHNPNMVSVAVWSAVGICGIAFMYWTVRAAIVLWHALTLQLGF